MPNGIEFYLTVPPTTDGLIYVLKLSNKSVGGMGTVVVVILLLDFTGTSRCSANLQRNWLSSLGV